MPIGIARESNKISNFAYMKKRVMKKKRVVLLLFLLLGLFAFRVPEDQYFEIAKSIDVFGRLVRVVTNSYVEEIDIWQFVKTGINSMLNSLDPYTNFIEASQIEDFRFMSTGQYGGIGAQIVKRGEYVVIEELYEGQPAARGGLWIGDSILRVNGKDVVGMGTTEVRDLLRGEPKSKVTVTVKRYGFPNPITVEIERDEIKVPAVSYYGFVAPHVGYVVLTNFTEGASKEVRNAIIELKKQDPQLRGLILDLRNNPGGLLIEAIRVSNLFVNKGEKIVETKGREPSANQVYYAPDDPLDTETPLVVLINGNSASASEIVAGVVQDLDRGVVVGQTSYGKGLVQTTKQLSYNNQMKITTAKYYTPSGRCIQSRTYTRRDGEGGVVKIPDSTRKTFQTRRGRVVRDAGGIEPDSVVSSLSFHEIVQHLLSQYLFFDYAVVYRFHHDSITPVSQFQVTDEDYRQFLRFLSERNYRYKPRVVETVEVTDSLLRKETIYQEMEPLLRKLRSKLDQLDSHYLESQKDQITMMLKRYIARMYFYQKGEREAMLPDDPFVQTAVYFLTHPEAYQKVLRRSE
jgi:carboxyl-terminal processing protease